MISRLVGILIILHVFYRGLCILFSIKTNYIYKFFLCIFIVKKSLSENKKVYTHI
jgi:hypothetical protein